VGRVDNVIQLDRVRCLECGTKYVKPADGGLIDENPGCPRCGYVGWIATKLPLSRAARRRFGAGRPPHPLAQSH
jgi:ribosomal protein S27AE